MVRTSILRLDNDALNLFFPFLIAYLLVIGAGRKGRAKYPLAVVAGLLLQLFYWWYPTALFVPAFVLAYAVSLAFQKKWRLKEGLIALFILVVGANPKLLVLGVENLIRLSKIYLGIRVSSHHSPYTFPNVLSTIIEAKRVGVLRLLGVATGNYVCGALGVVGIIILLFKKWRRFIPLVPILGLGVLSFKSANRFNMYLAPFLGMGLGYLTYLAHRGIGKIVKRTALLITCNACIVLIYPPFGELLLASTSRSEPWGC